MDLAARRTPAGPLRAAARALALLALAAAAPAACALYDESAERRDQARYSSEVNGVLRAMAPGRERCYEASPTARAHRPSTVVSSWSVDDTGRATDVEVEPSPPDAALRDCYRALIARQRYPVGNVGWRSRMEQHHDP